MHDLIDGLFPKDNFDAEWYFLQYPDVASSGIPAHEHYLKFGKKEGRYPKKFKSKWLEKKLWAGFSSYAIEELEALLQDTPYDLNETLLSAAILARWFHSQRLWMKAESYADILYQHLCRASDLPDFFYKEGVHLLVIDIYSRTNQYKKAKAILTANMSLHRSPDLMLLASNLAFSLSEKDTEKHEKNKLSLFNAVFEEAGLLTIVKNKESLPLSIDNLKGSRINGILSQYKASVIIPAYNAADYIETAINSIVNQTWKNIEIIVVDDASTDNTASIVESLAKKDSRIKLFICSTNRGPYSARNLALKHITGDFVLTLDSDDWLHPQRIERSLEPMLSNNNVKASIANWVRTEDRLHFKKPRLDGSIIHTSVSTLVFRTGILSALGGWDEVKIAADSELYERLINIYGPEAIAEIVRGVPLVFARDLPGSLTNTISTHAFSEFFGVRQLYRAIYLNWHKIGLGNQKKLNTQYSVPGTPAAMQTIDLFRPNYEIVLFGDFGKNSSHYDRNFKIIENLISRQICLAIFHWPDYKNSDFDFISSDFIQKVLNYEIDILVGDQIAHTEILCFLKQDNFNLSPDKVPRITFKRSTLLENSGDFLKETNYISDEFNASLIKDSGLFQEEWYISLYPDIKSSLINPLNHYINHGIHEGRSLSPTFNSDYYRETYLDPAELKSLPILHYLKFGRKRGNNTCPDVFLGKRPINNTYRTVLLCGHSSGKQLFGAERSIIEILDAYLSIKLNVVIAIPDFQNLIYLNELRKRSCKVVIVPSPLWTQSVEPYAWSVERFCEIIKVHSVDIVHINTIMQREPLIAAKSIGVPSIVHVHEILEDGDEACVRIQKKSSTIYKAVADLSDIAIANSNFTASKLIDFKEVYIVNNSVDFSSLDIRNIIDEKNIKISMISSNIEKKGVKDFFELAKKLVDISELKFLLIGPNTDIVKSLKEIYRPLSNIEFIDYVETPLDGISRANIVISLSLCNETFGRTILEGMAARRTVLAYAHGAFPELITSGKTGFLVPFLDLEKMAQHIKWLCANPYKIIEIGKSARSISIKKFNQATISRQLSAVYNSSILSSTL
ncbi:glycosyltransferase [Pseudomonas syringae]|nr:glycosyltransferase [Pseudomonas syringae]MBD8802853.1 glycosyltransferase [Pseudomonas syringae]MBD8813565.1 glycosyltransferase [Pseudomonas syringae]